MENTELHTEKVKILSRLVKDNTITLEEALLLLKEEEPTPLNFGNIPNTSTGTWTTTTPYTYSTPMYIRSSGNVGMASTSPSTTFSSSSFTSSIAEEPADLNN